MVARCGNAPCPACRSAACWCRWPPCAYRRTPGAWKSPSSPPATEPAKRTDHANRRPRPGNHQYPRAGRQPGRQRRYSVGAASPATPSAVRLGRARSAGTAGQPATLPGGQRPGRRHRPRQPGRKLHGLGRPQRRAVVAADRLAGQPHHPAHRASTRQRRRGAGPGTQRPAARCLFLGQQAGLDRRAPSCRSPGSRDRPPAPGNQRRLVSRPLVRNLRHRRHHRLAYRIDEPRRGPLGPRPVRPVRRADRVPAGNPRYRRPFRGDRQHPADGLGGRPAGLALRSRLPPAR